MFDGNVGCVGKRKIKDGGSKGGRGGLIWLECSDGGGSHGGDGKSKGSVGGGSGSSGCDGGRKNGSSSDGVDVLFFLFFTIFNLFLIAKSIHGGLGVLFTRSRAVNILDLSSSLSKDSNFVFLALKDIHLERQIQVDFASTKCSFLLGQVSV